MRVRHRAVLAALLAILMLPVTAAGSFAAAVYIPATISGGAETDRVGARGTVALSASGAKVAVAGSQTPDVRVFSWSGSALAQEGSTITWSGGGGRVVDLDDSGDSIVIGDPYNDAGGVNFGAVRVYDFDGSSWSLRGSAVTGVEITSGGNSAQDQFGKSVAFAGDGDSFIASGHGSSVCSGSGGSYGSLKVFIWSGVEWVLRGSAIQGDSCSDQLGRASNGKNRVQISDDGQVIAATTETETRIYGWDADSSSWTQLGSSISYTGQISLSDDGTKIAIGVDSGAGFVRVYGYSGGSWSLVGSQINGGVSGDNFFSVALDEDGDTLVVGAELASPRGEVSVLDWDGSSWTERFAAMQGSTSVGYTNFGTAVDVSEDGRITAGSDMRYDSYRGIVRLNAVGPFSLSYDLNSGTSGAPPSQSGDFNSSINVGASTPEREGYTFDGWSTTADGPKDYSSGEIFTIPLSDSTLYARWDENPALDSDSEEDAGSRGEEVSPPSAPISPPVTLEEAVIEQNGRASTTTLLPEEPLSFPELDQADTDARALLGGQLVDVAVSVTPTGGKLYTLGSVQMGMKAIGALESADNPSEPGFSILGRDTFSFSGVGLSPNAAVRVFVLLEDGAFLQLDDLVSNLRGEFVLEIDTSAIDQKQPMPIGKQKIQVSTLDALGNRVLIEIPLRVVQPGPEPLVPGFRASGGTVQIGQVESLVNGVSLVANSFASEAKFGIAGDGWEVQFEKPSLAQELENFEVPVSGQLAGNFAGFRPDSRVDVWLYSTPTLLTSTEIGPDGVATVLVDMDVAAATAGAHTLQVQGVNPDGYLQQISIAVALVEAQDNTQSENYSAGTQQTLGGVWLPATLATLALVGVILVLISLRRRRQDKST